MHVYMGMEVRGGFFVNQAPPRSIAREKLDWAGLKPGFIRTTDVMRRTHGHIHKAVLQAYYYVAGPKRTQLLMRCSAALYTEKKHNQQGTWQSFHFVLRSCLRGVGKACSLVA